MLKAFGMALAALTIFFLAHVVAAGANVNSTRIAARMDIGICNDSLQDDMKKKDIFDPSECKNPTKAVVVDDSFGMPLATVLLFAWLVYGALYAGTLLGEERAHRERDEEEAEENKGESEQTQST